MRDTVAAEIYYGIVMVQNQPCRDLVILVLDIYA